MVSLVSIKSDSTDLLVRESSYSSPTDSYTKFIKKLFDAIPELLTAQLSDNTNLVEYNVIVFMFEKNEDRCRTYTRRSMFHRYYEITELEVLYREVRAGLKVFTHAQIEDMTVLERRDYQKLKSVGTQRWGTPKLLREITALQKDINAESNLQPAHVVSSACLKFIQKLLTSSSLEIRIEKIHISAKYFSTEYPAKILQLNRCFKISYQCSTCDAWQTTMHKLMACSACRTVFYCDLTCRQNDPDHKKTCIPILKKNNE